MNDPDCEDLVLIREIVKKASGILNQLKCWLSDILGTALWLIRLGPVRCWVVCRDWAIICENTGSHRGYREWCTGRLSGQWYRESHLERFIRQQYPSELKNRWTCWFGTGKNIFGEAAECLDGFPRVGLTAMTLEIFDRYVDTLDDAAKLNLYHVLVSGDRDAIRAEEEKISAMVIAQRWPLRQP